MEEFESIYEQAGLGISVALALFRAFGGTFTSRPPFYKPPKLPGALLKLVIRAIFG